MVSEGASYRMTLLVRKSDNLTEVYQFPMPYDGLSKRETVGDMTRDLWPICTQRKKLLCLPWSISRASSGKNIQSKKKWPVGMRNRKQKQEKANGRT